MLLEVRLDDLLRDDHRPGVEHERSHLGLVDRVESGESTLAQASAISSELESAGTRSVGLREVAAPLVDVTS